MIEYFINLDADILRFINVIIKNSLLDYSMPVITYAGSFYLVILGGILCFFMVRRDKIYNISSFIIVMLTARYSYRFLKVFFARQRPMYSYDWVNIIGFPLQSYSFPSGHSTIAFTWAVFMALKYPKGRVYFLSAAFLVALSRVYMGVHYPSDVLAGAILGSFIALFCNYILEKIKESAVKRWSI
ncbi:MAG: phosphatase PAP2 family protein [Candidatus Schekmanbacteria bacterium]|nr:MAG: phosphatase PAP2 family protein [Candidatus Schekmanbacteria bacterium]